VTKDITEKVWNFSSTTWMWCRTFTNFLWHGEDCDTELCQKLLQKYKVYWELTKVISC